MTEIRVSLDQKSIEKAIKQLRYMAEDLEERTNKAVELLTIHGKAAAHSVYKNRLDVDWEAHDGVGRIIATGDKAIIAEFGAGFDTMIDHPMADNAPVDIVPGSYSREHGGKFARMLDNNEENPHWIFGGRPYDRVPARPGMLEARNYIMAFYEDIVREVLENDRYLS